jgi:hypothetical protein
LEYHHGCSDLFGDLSINAQEFITPSRHEPNLGSGLSWDEILEGFTFNAKVVGTKDGLLKGLLSDVI